MLVENFEHTIEGDIHPRFGQFLHVEVPNNILSAALTLTLGQNASGSGPEEISVWVNGQDLTEEIGGPFGQSVEYIDIKSYLAAGRNVLEFRSTKPGWLKALLSGSVPCRFKVDPAQQ